jgi:hypothetical protein
VILLKAGVLIALIIVLNGVTGLQDRTYASISQARADGNNARVWGGMHYPAR